MIEVHLKVETLAELAAELQRVLGPLLAAQGVVLPEAPKRGRPRKDGGAAAEQADAEEAPAPEPQPEAAKPRSVGEMRALMSRYQAAHPGGLTATLDLMKKLGGATRVLDCPVETWPAIAAAAEQYLARGEAA